MSKILDNIGLIIWILLVVGLAAMFVYFDKTAEGWSFNKSIPGVFNFLSSLVIPAFQVVSTIPALAYLCLNNPRLLQDRQLPNQRQPLCNLALCFVYYIIIIYNNLKDINSFGVDQGIITFYYGVYAPSCFVISTR